ncbi:MAG: hypothetical protein PHZ00_04510 [Candidatus Peribacteraceae bacterium]|nr:hypothetical protein [Candidatus Peribacteraceae bacterium]
MPPSVTPEQIKAEVQILEAKKASRTSKNEAAEKLVQMYLSNRDDFTAVFDELNLAPTQISDVFQRMSVQAPTQNFDDMTLLNEILEAGKRLRAASGQTKEGQ